jgi:hypothetical protein
MLLLYVLYAVLDADWECSDGFSPACINDTCQMFSVARSAKSLAGVARRAADAGRPNF